MGKIPFKVNFTITPHLRLYTSMSTSKAGSESLSFFQRFGIPISNVIMYSSLSLLSLHYLWTRLSLSELKEEREIELSRLHQEKEHWDRKILKSRP